MWYWQRYKNDRRRGAVQHQVRLRETILQVEKPRRARQRERLYQVGSVVLLLVVVAAALWLGTEGARRLGQALFSANDRFTVRTLDLVSDGKLQSWHIREYAGLDTGLNLFALDLGKIRRELESVPVVGMVTVTRVLPDTLRVRISERRAVARLGDEAGGQALAVDREGYALGPSSVSARLPVITGYRARGLRPGSRVEDPGIQSALALIDLSDEPLYSRFVRLRRVDVSDNEELRVELERGERIRFPRRDMQPRMERLCEIIKQSADEGRAIASVNMTVDRNFPVIHQ
ncbi:MAG: FtsQ-type POTRA domain-containing protein [Kiritimatiellae bacterium]|nr:FtsQ-type POTRA domain-containing protein [Kiritimatiellia bacterium]